MSMSGRIAVIATMVALMLGAMPTEANMTSAAIGVGGLVPVKTESIDLEREDLTISSRLVKVHYVFRNLTDHDIEMPVLFPLPEIELYLPSVDFYGLPGTKDTDAPLSLTLRVAGTNRQTEWLGHAYARDGRDITSLLRSLGIPLFAWYSFGDVLQRLSEADRSALFSEGYVVKYPDTGDISPNWTVRGAFSWKQVFPAGRSIDVDIEYPPLTGGFSGAVNVSAKTPPRTVHRQFSMNSEFSGLFPWDEDYCINHRTVAQLAKMRSKPDDEPDTYVNWVRYVLVTALNWHSPIKRFHLTVDKRTPGTVAAFCSPDGKSPIRQTGPTTYEVTIDDFLPRRNFDLLTISKDDWPKD